MKFGIEMEMPNSQEVPQKETSQDDSDEKEIKHEKFVSSSVSKAEMNKQIKEGEQKEETERRRRIEQEAEQAFQDAKQEVKEKVMDRIGEEIKENGLDNIISKTLRESLPGDFGNIIGSLKECVMDKLKKGNDEKNLMITEKFCKKLEGWGREATNHNADMSKNSIISYLEYFSRDATNKGFTEAAQQAMSSERKVERYYKANIESVRRRIFPQYYQ